MQRAARDRDTPSQCSPGQTEKESKSESRSERDGKQCKTSNESQQQQQKNLVSHIMAALLALFSFNFIVELHAEAMLNLKTLKE